MRTREIAEKIVTIIDTGCKYRIIRRPYDEAFAEAHRVSLEDITEERYVPCIECGQDVVPKILLSKTPGRKPVYCSPECRIKHSRIRIAKIDEKTDVNALAKSIVDKCLDISLDGHASKISQRSVKGSVAMLISETNSLLREILKEIRREAEK